jgi:hypothetical protein
LGALQQLPHCAFDAVVVAAAMHPLLGTMCQHVFYAAVVVAVSAVTLDTDGTSSVLYCGFCGTWCASYGFVAIAAAS